MIKTRAECIKCPTTKDPQYGHDVPVHVEYIDEANAYAWAHMHNDATGHAVRITKSFSMDINVEHVNPEVMNIMFGVDEDG